MGYYTAYKLSIESKNGNLNQLDVISDLRENCESAEGALSQTGDYGDYPCSWYDHEKDLSLFSQKYPDILFILSGEGEIIRDTWKCYFKNGNFQKKYGVINFQELDLSTVKLKDDSNSTFIFENDKRYFFNLEADKNFQLDIKILMSLISDLRNSYNGAKISLDENGEFNDSVDWSNCDNDLINFSKNYPNIIIKIGCVLPDFEDNRDWYSIKNLWCKDFYNGNLKVWKAFWYYNKPSIEFVA